ncbi:hypothetical protein LTR15_001355 [Elasticomyces elasticus]|nr:hypothetical protein LTR15_001355 [Elasticomyces elasticus]
MPDKAEETTGTTLTDGDDTNTENPQAEIIEIIKDMKLAGPLPPPDELASLATMMESMYQGFKYANDECGKCGQSEKNNGTKLLVCGKCKAMQYCSKECQRGHWQAHKRYCKVPSGCNQSMRGFDDVLAAADAWLDKKGYPKKGE